METKTRKTNARVTVVQTGHWDGRAHKGDVATLIFDATATEADMALAVAELYGFGEGESPEEDGFTEPAPEDGFTFAWLEENIEADAWFLVEEQRVVSVTPLGGRCHADLDLYMEGEDGEDLPEDRWVPTLKEEFPYVEFEVMETSNPWNGHPVFRVSGLRAELERFLSEPAIGDFGDWKDLIIAEDEQ